MYVVSSLKSEFSNRSVANEDFIELAQSPLSICLNCRDLTFFVPFSRSTLVHFSAIPT